MARKRLEEQQRSVEYQQDLKGRSTIALAGKPPHSKPRVWVVKRTRYGVTLASTTDGKFAVGKGLRTGADIPRAGVTIYPNEQEATAAYLKETP